MAPSATWSRGTDWTPKVTAILPCYKAEAFISRTLESLAAQTWPDLEILIGDDASPDGTLAIVEEFAGGRSDTRIIARERNLGWLANTNALMAEARGELMFFAWHDDVVAPDYVERLVAALRGNPRAVLAFCDLEMVQPDGTRSVVVFDALSGVRSPAMRALRMAIRSSGYWVTSHGLFQAEAFGRIGGIKSHEGGEFSATWPWLLHMATLGQFERVPEALCQHRFQESSLSRRWEYTRAQHMAVERAALRTLRETPLDPVPKALVTGLAGANFSVKHRMPRLHERLLRPLKQALARAFRAGSEP